jgi:hypothetical protein
MHAFVVQILVVVFFNPFDNKNTLTTTRIDKTKTKLITETEKSFLNLYKNCINFYFIKCI